MTKTERIEKFMRKTANEILVSPTPDAIYTLVTIEDITLKGEKWCLRDLIVKYERIVSDNNYFELDDKVSEKVLEICKSRLARLEQM